MTVDGCDGQLTLTTPWNNLPFWSVLLLLLVGTMLKSELGSGS